MIADGTTSNILKGAEIIRSGGLVAFPTETVYGLGGNSLDATAVAKIFEAKQRPSFDPLITHIADLEMLDRIADIRDSKVFDIIDAFWPGSLTVIVPKRKIIPDLVTSGLPTMAVRMPAHPIALELIRQSTGAVAAPSANPFGYLSPTTAQHVEEQLGDRIDMVLDGGTCPVGVESTVLDLTRKVPIVLRPGGIPVEKLRDAIGEVEVFNRKVVSPTAPGQLEMHYSPGKPLHIVDDISTVSSKSGAAALVFGQADASGFDHVRNLSPDGDLVEAAASLFVLLHELDSVSGVQAIYAQRIPEEGMGRAVMDRIYKASVK